MSCEHLMLNTHQGIVVFRAMRSRRLGSGARVHCGSRLIWNDTGGPLRRVHWRLRAADRPARGKEAA